MESINQHDARDIGQTARCIAAILRAYLVIPLGAYNAQKPTPEFSMPAIKTTGVSNLVEMLQDNNRCSAAADAIAALAEYGIFTCYHQLFLLIFTQALINGH